MGRAQQRMVRDNDERRCGRRQKRTPEPLQVFRQNCRGGSRIGSLPISSARGNQENHHHKAGCCQSRGQNKVPFAGAWPAGHRLVHRGLRHRGFFRHGPAENGHVVTRGQVNAERPVSPVLFVVFLELAPDLVGLDAYDRVLLWIKVRTPFIHFDANQILIELLPIAEKSLFRDKLKKARLLR